MAAQRFVFEDCPLKHYVRVKGWLPHCKARRAKANAGLEPTKYRRLRYFTFCAIGAIDVLMLNVAKVISLSREGKFDTVVFFDYEPDAVLETQKRIPGAIGFPGSFTDVVLASDPAANLAEHDDLAPPSELQDEFGTWENQRIRAQRRGFIKQFPFDIVNLDLEEFAFKPNDPFPGKVINALRKTFEWQRAPLYAWPDRPTKSVYLDGFTLMFTTRIGPPNISEEYTDMLRGYLEQNVASHPDLGDILLRRKGAADLAALQSDHFDDFFKLGVPKVLAALLLETDWYVDAEKGITTFAFKRLSEIGEYTMLHFVLDVKRQTPPRERRAPNSGHSDEANEAYASVVSRLFTQDDIEVTNELASSTELKPSLADIRGRRRKYHPEDV